MSEVYCIVPRGSADVSERKRTKQKLENTKKKFALDGIRGMFDLLYSKTNKNGLFHYTAFPFWFIPVLV